MANTYESTAWLYDVDERDNLSADIPFYLDYARQQQPHGAVLELGCGTGRVALALAREGFNVTGLDLSESMLGVFGEKLGREPSDVAARVELVRGNMAQFDLGKRFGMIIAPFRAFQALTDDADIRSSLVCIRDHLTDDGVYIANVFNPFPVMDQSWCYPESVQWERRDQVTGNYVVKKTWGDRIDTSKQIIYPHYAFEITYPDGHTQRIAEDMQLKYYYADQLAVEVERAGMVITERYAWYDKTPLDELHREIIYICTRGDA